MTVAACALSVIGCAPSTPRAPDAAASASSAVAHRDESVCTEGSDVPMKLAVS